MSAAMNEFSEMLKKENEMKKETEMKKELPTINFDQLKGTAKKVWGQLTDEDFRKAGGSVDKLYGVIHDRFGDTKEDIKAKLAKAQIQR